MSDLKKINLSSFCPQPYPIDKLKKLDQWNGFFIKMLPGTSGKRASYKEGVGTTIIGNYILLNKEGFICDKYGNKREVTYTTCLWPKQIYKSIVTVVQHQKDLHESKKQILKEEGE